MENEILYAVFPLVPFAIGAGASILGGLLGGRSSPSDREKRLKGQFDTATSAEGRESRESRQAQRDFDPRSAVLESTRAQFEILRPDFEDQQERLVGSAVGQGRLRTGFLTEDQEDLTRQQRDRFAQFASRQALGAESLNLRNIEGRARSQDRFGDFLTGGIDQELNEREARDQSRARFGESIGQIGGFLAGGLFNKGGLTRPGGRGVSRR